ncbi:MAG: hotdog domain-containing protein, partial [Ilumatobacteraceae bacterium]
DLGFAVLVKMAAVEGLAPARVHDVVDCEVRVTRWGNTSFDVEVVGTIKQQPIFTAVTLNVSTTPGAPVPVPVPDSVKVALAD